MNIHLEQVIKKTHIVSYLLAAFAIFLALLFVMSLVRHAEIHWLIPSVTVQTTSIKNSDIPVAIPAPLSPTEATTANSTTETDGNAISIVIPQSIPAPAPSVP